MTDTPLRVWCGSWRHCAVGSRPVWYALSRQSPCFPGCLLCVRFCTEPLGQQWRGAKCAPSLSLVPQWGRHTARRGADRFLAGAALQEGAFWVSSSARLPFLIEGVPCALVRHRVAADTGTRKGHCELAPASGGFPAGSFCVEESGRADTFGLSLCSGHVCVTAGGDV